MVLTGLGSSDTSVLKSPEFTVFATYRSQARTLQPSLHLKAMDSRTVVVLKLQAL